MGSKRAASILLCVIASAASTTVVMAREWTRIVDAVDGAVWFADYATLRVSPPITIYRPFEARQIWVKTDYSKVRTERARSSMSLYSIDCARRSSAVLSHIRYHANGTVIRSWTDDDMSFKYEIAPPDSMIEALVEALCD